MTGRLSSSRLHPPQFEVPSDTGWDGKRWTPPDPDHDDRDDPALYAVGLDDVGLDGPEPSAPSDAATSTSSTSQDPESTVRIPAAGATPLAPPRLGPDGGVTAAEATQVVAPAAAPNPTSSESGADRGSERGGRVDEVDDVGAGLPLSGTEAPRVNGHDPVSAAEGADPPRPPGPPTATRNGHHVNGTRPRHPLSAPGNADATLTQRVPAAPRDDDPDRTQVVGDNTRRRVGAAPAASPPPAESEFDFGPGTDQAPLPPRAAPGAGGPPTGPALPGPPGPLRDGRDRHWPDQAGWPGEVGARPGTELAPIRDVPLVPGPAGGEVGPARRASVVLDEAMAQTARETWPPISDADLDVALAAGDHAHARALTDPRAPVADAAEHAALDAVVDATERAVTVARLGPRHEPGRAPWGRAGLVLPVLGATGGVGASVVAAALFDALDAAGVRTLLVDAADPQRSGLASAARNQGAASRTLHPDVGVAFARRGEGWMAQMAIRHGAVVAASMVPAPSWWLPDGEDSAPEVTVVDLGWDSWSLAAAPLRGAGAWLEAGSPAPRPVLVVAPTRPGLAQANQLLARLRPWIEAGRVAPMAGLAVVGARRWPRDVPGVAARALGPLLSDAVFLPNDAETRTAGIGPRPLAARLQRSVAPLLADWNLMPPRGRAPKRHSVAYRRT